MRIYIYLLFFAVPSSVLAQDLEGIDVVVGRNQTETEAKPEIKIELDREDWVYQLGEEAVFAVKAYKDGRAYEEGKIQFSLGPEKMPATKQGEIPIQNGEAKIMGGTMGEPGFLRCDIKMSIDGRAYTARATAAFAPEKIKPTTQTPPDFSSFWQTAIERSKSIPLNTKLTRLDERGTNEVDVYQVEYEFHNQVVRKFYGVLCIPKKKGKYPAIIRFPGAGWIPLSGDKITASQGFITLDLYIHGRPITEKRDFYEDLKNNELRDYMYQGISNRDSFYYKNVILGCVRAVDLIYDLPYFDGENLGAWGSSQGGALSIMTSALEDRIDYTVALCPAMCDFTGYLHDRAGGWPHLFTRPELYADRKEQVIESLSYYDVVHFAKRLKAPVFFSWGFNDPTTPPTSIYVAYNVVDAPKKLYIIPEGVHKIYPRQRSDTYAWLMESLTKDTNKK